jgi:penicillin-binding protein 1C
VRAAHRPSDLTLLDRHGTPVQTLRVDKTVRRLPGCRCRTCRRRCCRPSCSARTGASGSTAASTGRPRRAAPGQPGQHAHARRVDADDAARRPDRRGLARPPAAAALAEARPGGGGRPARARWRKSQILEAYLNEVPFRGEVVGINALSQTLFGKHPSGLDAQEAAVAAALVRGPNASPGRGRRAGLRRAADDAARLRRRAHAGRPNALVPRAACRWASSWRRTSRARCCGATARRAAQHARRRLQRVACSSAPASWPNCRAATSRTARCGARQPSGEVLAWVGANGEPVGAAQVDGVLARRQPGSTLKPFVYGLAFERRLITPASLLDDSPAQIPTARPVPAAELRPRASRAGSALAPRSAPA